MVSTDGLLAGPARLGVVSTGHRIIDSAFDNVAIAGGRVTDRTFVGGFSDVVAIAESAVASMPEAKDAITVNLFDTVIRAEATVADNASINVSVASSVPTVSTFGGVRFAVVLVIDGTHMEVVVAVERSTGIASCPAESTRHRPIGRTALTVITADRSATLRTRRLTLTAFHSTTISALSKRCTANAAG